jgi:hypothetical protein
MDALNKKARVAGFLYLALVILGPLPLLYIPTALFVPGNGAATAHNLVTHEALFRFGIFDTVLSSVVLIFVALALYRLFEDVNRTLAALLVIWGALIPAPISILNELNSVGALLFAKSAPFLASFATAQREAMVLVFFNLHHYGNVFNEMFWGLWLLPFGMLVYTSGFLPRALGVWLVLNGFAYVAQDVTGIMYPQYIETIANIAFPVQFGEIAIMLWLLIMGARPRLSFARA